MRGYDRTKAAWRTAFSARRAVLGGRGRLAKQARFVAGKIKRQDAAYVDVLVKARGKRIGPRSRVRLRADNLFGPCGWGAPLWPRNASNFPLWKKEISFSANRSGLYSSEVSTEWYGAASPTISQAAAVLAAMARKAAASATISIACGGAVRGTVTRCRPVWLQTSYCRNCQTALAQHRRPHPFYLLSWGISASGT